MATVTELYRHPVKSHGREALSSVILEAGKTMPGDRVWAVAHDAAKFNEAAPEWAHCVNFSRGAKAPGLMAINVSTDATGQRLTFTHPKAAPITIDPSNPAEAAAFVAWTLPLVPRNRALPQRLVSAPDRGMTDTPFASISINSHASLRALSAEAGTEVSPLRWRGNIWIDGTDPWAERDWIGRELRIGGTRLAVCDHIKRCPATTANPETGTRDLDTLGLLERTWGHQDFGVYAKVLETGPISTGDTVTLV